MPNARQHRLVDVLGQDGVEVIDASGLGDSHGLLLRGPKEREIDPFGQGLGGELGRLVPNCGPEIAPRTAARLPHVWPLGRRAPSSVTARYR